MRKKLASAEQAKFTKVHEATLNACEQHIDLIMQHLGLTYDDEPRLISPPPIGAPPIHATDTAKSIEII